MALPESELQKSMPHVTIAAYLDFERQAEERHEYLDGFIYAMAGESPPARFDLHQPVRFVLVAIERENLRDVCQRH